MSGVLVVRSGGEAFGLPLADVEELVAVREVLPAPVTGPAVRGLLPVRDGLVPLIHLRAVLRALQPPAVPEDLAVLLRGGQRRIAVEITEAVTLLREAGAAPPAGWDLPWAVGVARFGDGLLPIVDATALVGRVRERTEATRR